MQPAAANHAAAPAAVDNIAPATASGTFADIISDAIEALANSTKENLHLQAEAQAAYGSGGKVEGETNLNGELGATAATSKGYGVDVAARFSGSPFKSAKPVQGAYTALTASGGAPISVSFTFAVDANRNWELTTAVGTGASLFIGTEIGYKYSQNP